MRSSYDTERSTERRSALYPTPPPPTLSRYEQSRNALAEKHADELKTLGEHHKAAGDKLRREQQNERARHYGNFHQRELPQEMTDKWAKERKTLEGKHDGERTAMQRHHRSELTDLKSKHGNG